MAPKQSGHMNITPDVTASAFAAPTRNASQLDTSSHAFQRRSALPLLDSVAYDPCPSRWNRGLARVVPVSLALFGAMAFGATDGVLPSGSGASHSESPSLSASLSELARVARMQLVAADAAYVPQALTGAASELTPSAGSDRGSARSERSKQRREAAEARRAAYKEKREAAKQARLEARAARLEARKAKRGDSDDDDESESSSAADRRAAAKEKREARREAMAERRAAAKEKREAAAAERREAAEERRSAYLERKAAAKEKRESASESKHASIMERREAAKERREAALAARREAAEEKRAAAEEKREAARAAKEERLAAKESRRHDSSSLASSSMGGSGGRGTFGHAEATMAPANGAALLRINSRPWAQVYVDGRLVGNTPQLALQLPPGEHNVRLVNGIFAMGKVLNVKLRAGERVTKVEMLEE